MLRAQRDAEASVVRLAFTAQNATGAAAKARALASELDARIAASRAAVAASQSRFDAIEGQRRILERRLAAERQPIARLIAGLVALQRRPAALAFVQPASLDSQAHVRAAIHALVPAIEARTAGLRAQVAQLDQVRAAAAVERSALDRAGTQLVAQQAALSRYAAGRLRSAETATGQGLAAQDRALALADDVAQLQRALDEARVDAATATRLGALPRMAMQPGGAQPPLSYRIPAGAIVTGFGEQLDDGRRSAALVIAPQPDAAILAPHAGKIAFAGSLKGYGRVVIIEHGGGWTTVIAGLADASVVRGDQVSAGAPVGRAPSADPAIRLELRQNGTPVPPTRLAG